MGVSGIISKLNGFSHITSPLAMKERLRGPSSLFRIVSQGARVVVPLVIALLVLGFF